MSARRLPSSVAYLLMLGCLPAIPARAQSAASQTATGWPPQAGQYRLHVIGNAHIDAPWLWPSIEPIRYLSHVEMEA
jgi:hypothetical protein